MSEMNGTNNRRRVLGVFAHPDDAEIWAGGTLVAHREVGDLVSIATFDQGEPIRIDEAYAGAALLDVDLRLIKASLEQFTESVLAEVVSLLFDLKPTILITHWANDCHPHHRLVFDLASRGATKLKIATGFPQSFYSCDTYNSLGLSGTFEGSAYVDVTEQWETKLKAIDAHKSQAGANWKQMIEIQAGLNGKRIGRPYAETFREIPILGRVAPKKNLW